MKLGELSRYLEERGFSNVVDGDPDTVVESVNTLDDAGPGDISFLANPRYKDHLTTSRAGAVIVKPDQKVPPGMAAIRCGDPYAAITMAIIRIHGHRRHPRWGTDERACIDPSARIGEGANIGPFVTIASGVVIGNNATIYPGCYIGDGARIGDDAVLYPNVVIYEGSRIGNRVTMHAGTVIGQDGLGYAPLGDDWLKIPQIGSVIVADDVEIGASCAIDRATLGATEIGRGTKLSDQVVIGHGCKMGERCMVVAQVGIAGSVTIGDHVILHGQVGINGHTTIGDNAIVGGKSGVWQSIPANAHYHGDPAIDIRRARRRAAILRELPEMHQRLRQLVAEVEQLSRALAQRDED